jgi:hypothetical protein
MGRINITTTTTSTTTTDNKPDALSPWNAHCMAAPKAGSVTLLLANMFGSKFSRASMISLYEMRDAKKLQEGLGKQQTGNLRKTIRRHIL